MYNKWDRADALETCELLCPVFQRDGWELALCGEILIRPTTRELAFLAVPFEPNHLVPQAFRHSPSHLGMVAGNLLCAPPEPFGSRLSGYSLRFAVPDYRGEMLYDRRLVTIAFISEADGFR